MKKFAVFLTVVFALQGFCYAVPTIVFPGKKLDPAQFSHDSHLKQKLIKDKKCSACHPKIFAKMKKGANKIAMVDINKGKFCGVCHTEKGNAFAASSKDNCAKCHLAKKSDKAEKVTKSGGPKDIDYLCKSIGQVTFSHASHLEQDSIKDKKCSACHPKIFAKMKKSANKMTMADINKGKFCGICHTEKGSAFAASDKNNCSKCHA